MSTHPEPHDARLDARWQELVADLRLLLAADVGPLAQNWPQDAPAAPGVYHLMERCECGWRSLYVGCSANLQRTMGKLAHPGKSRRTRVARRLVKLGICPSERAAADFLTNRCLVQYVRMEDCVRRRALRRFAFLLLRPVLAR